MVGGGVDRGRGRHEIGSERGQAVLAHPRERPDQRDAADHPVERVEQWRGDAAATFVRLLYRERVTLLAGPVDLLPQPAGGVLRQRGERRCGLLFRQVGEDRPGGSANGEGEARADIGDEPKTVNALDLLDADRLAELELELQFLTEARRARNADSVADLLLALGPLTTQEVTDRSTVDAASTLDGLEHANRVMRIHWSRLTRD